MISHMTIRLISTVPLILAALLIAFPVRADSKAEAAEVARSAGCTPNKTTVVRYRPGEQGETVYKLTCQEDKNVFVHVRCSSRNCALLRTPGVFSDN